MIRKAFDIHFVTNESDNKLILFERRFDVIFTSFSSSFKVRYDFRPTISDPLKFAEKIRQTNITADEILVSYDVSSLFTNVPVDETIQLLADKAFKNNWFNEKNRLNIKKTDLIKLLNLATKYQLFQFNGKLYEQVDGVAMGSPLGPLMANAFMCSLEDKLSKSNNLSSFYNRYADDTLTKQSSLESAESFLSILNNCHPSLNFTMEVEQEGKIPFLGMEVTKKDGRLETKVYIKPTKHWSPAPLSQPR